MLLLSSGGSPLLPNDAADRNLENSQIPLNPRMVILARQNLSSPSFRQVLSFTCRSIRRSSAVTTVVFCQVPSARPKLVMAQKILTPLSRHLGAY